MKKLIILLLCIIMVYSVSALDTPYTVKGYVYLPNSSVGVSAGKPVNVYNLDNGKSYSTVTSGPFGYFYQVSIEGEPGDTIRVVVDYDNKFGQEEDTLSTGPLWINIFLIELPPEEPIPEFTMVGILLVSIVLLVYIFRKRR